MTQAVRAGLEVLLVEDQPQLLEFLQRALRREGLGVRTARSADEALQMLGAGPPPHALVCDIRTPGCLDGLELCRWARCRFPTLTILVQTGTSDVPTGDFHVLRKPFTPEQLLRHLHRLLDDLGRFRWRRARHRAGAPA